MDVRKISISNVCGMVCGTGHGLRTNKRERPPHPKGIEVFMMRMTKATHHHFPLKSLYRLLEDIENLNLLC